MKNANEFSECKACGNPFRVGEFVVLSEDHELFCGEFCIAMYYMVKKNIRKNK